MRWTVKNVETGKFWGGPLSGWVEETEAAYFPHYVDAHYWVYRFTLATKTQPYERFDCVQVKAIERLKKCRF